LRKIPLLSLLIAVLILSRTHANSFEINQIQSSYDLQSAVHLLQDEQAIYSIADFTDSKLQTQFQAYDNHSIELKPYIFYWGKIDLVNKLPDAEAFSEWVLRLSNTWTELDIYIRNADGSFDLQKSGTFVPQSQKIFKATTEGNLIKLHLLPRETKSIYFRGKSERASIPPNFQTSLQHADDFYSALQQRKTGTAIFVGFVLMMLIYNLILYFFGRDGSYIYYSIYLLSLVIYAPFISEDLADWFESSLFPNHPKYLYFGKFAIYFGLMAYLIFVRRFLDLERLLPKWDRIFKFLFYLGFPLMILDLFLVFTSNFSYVVADKVTVSYIVLFVIAVFVFIYQLFKTKDKKGIFIIVGIIFMGLGFLLTAIARGNTPAFSLIYFKIGTILEIIVFSLGLAYRQREIERARQLSDFELEKSKLLQAQEHAESDRLKELDQFKSKFYTNITHEFRTPLTVIMGINENIKGHEQEKKLIHRNSKKLLQLINQLLDLSKVESGNLKLNLVQGNIVSYIQYLAESFYSMATEKGIRLTFYTEEESILMDFDEVKIQHIIYNLVSNAIKFTAKNGKVILHLTTVTQDQEPLLKIKIKDNGEGIRLVDLPYIFDRFYQAEPNEKATGTKPEGSGIGLALTKEFVQMLKGKIEVISTPGKGSKFIIYLPIEQNAKYFDSSIIVPLSNTNHKPEQEVETSKLSSNENESSFEESKPQLLLVEDNPDIVTYIESILKKDYAILVANDGQSGIDQAIKNVPDIIISDVMMPEKNGYELCEVIKQDERTSHIPIILLTAKATQADRVDGLKHGADAYLTKPFDKEELQVRLQKLVEMRQQLQLRYANPNLAKTSIAAPSIEDIFLQKLHEQIEAHLSDSEFGVTQLVESIPLSQMQLYRKLKALTGKTPSQFMSSYRLQRALELLKIGELNVSEIAYEVGFADPSYFSRMFQKEFGRNPSQFLID
jgi:signal transduction histidine kinase/DNA-binding response OmpR family regulator